MANFQVLNGTATNSMRPCGKLDADSGLLCIIGSYGDTVDDEKVLERLRQWNHDSEGKAIEIEVTPREEPVPSLS